MATDTIYMREYDDELVVSYTFYRGGKGKRDRWGVPLEPDEPPTVELEEVMYQGADILPDLSRTQEREIEQKVYDLMCERAQADAIDWEDYRRSR